MSSSPPPSYYRNTTVPEKPSNMSEKPDTVSEKPAGSRTYHLTLERRKWTIMLASGLPGSMGAIEDRDAAITISDNATWYEVREEIWRLYKEAWPAILGKAKLEDYAVGADLQYTALDGGIHGHISMLELEEDAFWEFRKRDDIHIVRFAAYCSPFKGGAPGKVGSTEYISKYLGLNVQKPRKKSHSKEASKSQHRCILQ
ncbi:hypothetical protein QM012_002698 [Aureobasidium pullulans]|uniref:Uncharacterized protein n=1 Tax=Aureobasidium pullulans TaxID=5580 RepID=A0ABR0TAA5_AURPU